MIRLQENVGVAQWIEHSPPKRVVVGSIPTTDASSKNDCIKRDNGLSKGRRCLLMMQNLAYNDAPVEKSQIYQGNCLEILPTLAANAVDLIITSPPYADQRKDTYGGVNPDKYVEWFLPIADELKRVLKDEGSFILNIKERVVNGERHTYVLELILALRKQGWLWTEEYVWHKKNSYPGKWLNRFRDGWERCLRFTKQKHFAMYQDEVRVPMGDWKHSRLKNLSETDKRRDNSRVQSGFGEEDRQLDWARFSLSR